MGPTYHDDMLYSDLIPKERKFEDFCYRCAILKQHLHAYVDTKSMGVWTDSTYIPISAEFDTDKICYFLFYFEFTKAPDSERLSNVSLETAPFVIKTCINLRGSENFLDSMNTVISDIQKKTESFCSCIIMIDRKKGKYAPLCSKFDNDSAKIEDFMPYLTPEVVFSWEDLLKFCDYLIVQDEQDMQELEKKSPIWAKSLKGAEVHNVILVPLSQGKRMFGVLFITNFNGDRIVEIKEFHERKG